MSERSIFLESSQKSDGRAEVRIYLSSIRERDELQALLLDADIMLGFSPSASAQRSREESPSSYNAALGPIYEYVSATLGAAGGFGGLAAVLKVFLTRNKFKKARFGNDGQLLEVEGLSAGEIAMILNSLSGQHIERRGRLSDSEIDALLDQRKEG
jgi:hypothetical protein